MKKPLRILILEDRQSDIDLLEYELQEAGFVYTARKAMAEEEFVQALREFRPDLVLSDYDLPQYDGLSALAQVKTICPDVPFILVTGAIGEDRAIDILTRGAKDYVMKGRLNRLAPAIQRALAEAKEHRARKKAEQALRKAHDNLEVQVEKRTADLQAEIAERKRTEESLRASRQRIEAILDSITDIYLSLDSQWRFTELNPQAEGLCGMTKEELIGKVFWDVFPQSVNDEHQKMIAMAMAERISVHFEEFSQTFGKWFETHVYPTGDGLSLYLKDITQRKQNERMLKEYTVQLEAVNKELESFSYSVSHDLREPLRAIDGFSRMLAKELHGKIDEPALYKLDVIRDKAKKMNQLIEEILIFSRLGLQALTVARIDMEGLASEVWNELRELHEHRDIVTTIAHLAPCSGDRKLIRQVLVNLLSNAVKFTNGRNPARIDVGGYENGNEYVYSVKDNGAGFDMQYYDQLFKIFHRLHGEEDYEGTGVGLSIVKRIIERHGGRVWAEGKIGEGATFFFALPSNTGLNGQ